MMTGRIMTVVVFLGMAHGTAGAAPVTVNAFSDILFWTGSGTNSASLVLRFPTAVGSGTATPAAIAWGYHWNGSATFADMLFALAGSITGGPTPVAGADPRLSVDVADYGPGFGYFLNTVAYDQVGLPAEWSQVMRVIAPYDPDIGEYPAQYQLDLAGGAWSATPFALSDYGLSGTPLADGGWYGFVQADGSAATYAFAQPAAAVPEPSTWAMLACGTAWVAMWRRRMRAA